MLPSFVQFNIILLRNHYNGLFSSVHFPKLTHSVFVGLKDRPYLHILHLQHLLVSAKPVDVVLQGMIVSTGTLFPHPTPPRPPGPAVATSSGGLGHHNVSCPSVWLGDGGGICKQL